MISRAWSLDHDPVSQPVTCATAHLFLSHVMCHLASQCFDAQEITYDHLRACEKVIDPLLPLVIKEKYEAKAG